MTTNFWIKLKKRKQPILALAPMAGITDAAFRQLCKMYGADVVYTEMISADGLYYDSKKTLIMLKFKKIEQPVIIQLFGKHPEHFTKAAHIAERFGFAGIDINFGCPARKVAGHGGGVTLMRDLEKSYQIIEKTLQGTKLPVSIKLRSSIKDLTNQKTITALEFIEAVNDLPISAIMIHGRPYENPFHAEIDYQMIKLTGEKFLAKHSQGVFLGNGGVNTPELAKKMMEETGCQGVGLARGLYGKPWLFKQCKDYFHRHKYQEFSYQEIKKVMLKHAKLIKKNNQNFKELRKHLVWYVKSWPNARELRSKLVVVENFNNLKQILKDISF